MKKIIRTIEGVMPKGKWFNRNKLNRVFFISRMIISQTLRGNAKQLDNCFLDEYLIKSITVI